MAFWRPKKKQDQPGSDSATPPPETPSAGDAELSPPEPAPSSSSTEKGSGAGVFSKFRSALQKTSRFLNTDIRDLWKAEGRLVDDQFLEELFAILVKSDMGGTAARRIRDRVGNDFRARVVHLKEVLELIRTEIRDQLQPSDVPLRIAESGPTVILVVGVNGSGKTTSIAKLAYRLTQQGKRVVLGAGDTFRAAAVEQLTIWSERIGSEIVRGDQGSDPGSVAFRAAAKAKEAGFDVCIIDTAGRLQTQTHLMQELDKIRRVVGKQIEGAPHEVLLVLDSTAGQNAISQARGFSEAAGCTGIILSKLDGTAKGGVVIPIREQFQLPVKFIGLGEQLGDLAEFDPDVFTRALFDS